MKKILMILSSVLILQACSNNGGEGGAVDDGMKEVGDTNGGLPDTSGPVDPSKDTSIDDDRVDTQKRDSAQKK
jgi:hypothetical protein